MKEYSQFHDGSLDGFWNDGDLVHIFLSTESKKRFTMVAEGVAALGADGFRKGHIIFDVLTRTHEDLNQSDIATLYDLQSGDAGQRQADKLLEKARQERLIVLEINPSYGASCLVLARTFDLLSRKEWLERYLSGPSC
jgi:hypothetical protein